MSTGGLAPVPDVPVTTRRAYLLRTADRVLRTGLQTVLGYLITATAVTGVAWDTAALATGLAMLVSLLKNLFDVSLVLPRTAIGDVIARAIHTAAQSALGSIGAAVLLTDVAFGTVLSASLLAALVSLVNSGLAWRIGPAPVQGTADVVPLPGAPATPPGIAA